MGPTARVLLLVVVAFALVETGLRVQDWRRNRPVEFYLPKDESNTMYVPHPYIGATLRPGFVGTGEMPVRINALGMRDEPRSVHKPDGVYRILCIGGSTTFGSSVTSVPYPARLQALLNGSGAGAPDGRRYEVWNCGVPGYTTIENLIYFELVLLEYDPDAILVYHAANDARMVQTSGLRPDYSHVRTAWGGLELSPLELFLLGNVRTYARSMAPKAVQNDLAARLMKSDMKQRALAPDDPTIDEGIDVFVRNLRNLVLVARGNGVVPIFSTFATCPDRLLPRHLNVIPTVERMNERILALGAEESVAVVELAGRIADPEHFTDWMHLTNEGTALHARLAYEQLLELGALR
jgi:hypothetical protein